MLLARLLLESINGDSQASNVPDDEVPLSDREATELLSLLQSLVTSKEFMESAFFVEGVTKMSSQNDRPLRKVFLSRRELRGRKRIRSRFKWGDFLQRVGWGEPGLYNDFGKKIAKLRFNAVRLESDMPLDHFFRMEKKLFEALELHPKVIELLLSFMVARRQQFEKSRNDGNNLAAGSLRAALVRVVGSWKNGRIDKHIERLTRQSNLTAATIIVSNMAVLFTTRDWSATGTLSMIAGAIMTEPKE